MAKKVTVLLLAAFICSVTKAQNAFQTGASEQDSLPAIISKLHLQQDPRLTSMVKWQIANNREKNGIDGWRVEIFDSYNSDAREQAEKVKKEFLTMYPDIGAYIQFRQPVFKVRVGDFRTRNEALRLRKQIMWKYPKSFEVKDIINFPKLSTDKLKAEQQ